MMLHCPHCQKANRLPAQRAADMPNCGACGQSLFSSVVELDSQGLADITEQSGLPVIVDFWAPWCGPCRMFAPTFEAAARKHAGEVLFIKVNTEAEQQAAIEHNIRSIPTLAVFHGGEELGRVSGALPPAQLEQLIEQVKNHAKGQA